jgi:hypothetical protein
MSKNELTTSLNLKTDVVFLLGFPSIHNLQVSAKKIVPNKKGDVGMWVGSHPKSYVTDQ